MRLELPVFPRFQFHALYDRAPLHTLYHYDGTTPGLRYIYSKGLVIMSSAAWGRRSALCPFRLRYTFSRIPTMFSLSPQSCSRLPVFHLFGLLLPWRMLLIMGIPTKCGVGYQNKDRGKMQSIDFDTCDSAFSIFPRRAKCFFELMAIPRLLGRPLSSPALFAFSSGNSRGYMDSLHLNGTKDLGALSFRLSRCYVEQANASPRHPITPFL
ncbi:uncharacterized protein J3D65DRAFT_220976 [Phyllosticta citribraziliensis]|uniref:Uncharacterized protein n=1 Tax=Phyllosticta citribraziliensis TaxID=989973 RepID=A0ABR1M4Q8_9PEZI